MNKLYIELKIKVILNIDSIEDVDEVMGDLNYEILDGSGKAEILDTEIVDYEVVDAT